MWAFFHGAVNTRAAPMLDVVEHAAPVVTQSQLLLSFKGSLVSGRNIIVTEGQNFVTQGAWNDQLGTNARFSSTCKGEVF